MIAPCVLFRNAAHQERVEFDPMNIFENAPCATTNNGELSAP